MSEPGRLALGLGLAALLPPFVPWVRARRWRTAVFAAGVAAWTLYPFGRRPIEWGIATAVVILQVVVKPSVRDGEARTMARPAIPALAASATALGAALVADRGATGSAFERALESDRALAITLGLLVALFPIGALIGRLTGPWAHAVEKLLRDEPMPRGLEGAGRYIGWLERGAIFAAVLIGRPEAIAVILTAKSIARFPSFGKEAFAEYYLIGTLLSVIAGAGVAIATRLALGLSPL